MKPSFNFEPGAPVDSGWARGAVSAQSHVNRVSIPPMRQATLLGLLVLAATLSFAQGLELPARWEYSAPLIFPEVRDGELIRASNDETLTVDPEDLRFLLQGMLEADKSGKGYGAFSWRLGLLTPKSR